MIKGLIRASLKQRLLVILASVVVIGLSFWSAIDLNLDAIPDITGPQVQINTAVPALAAAESEQLVTFPTELALTGLPGLQEMRSLTKFGLSQLTLIFTDNTDIFRARQLVSERLQRLQNELPPGCTPQMAPISTGLGEIMYYTLGYQRDAKKKPATEREQLMELYETQQFVVRPALRGVPGVADVNTNGGYMKQVVVQPLPEQLARVGMTFSEFADAVQSNELNAGGGIIDRDEQQMVIRLVSKAATLDEIRNIPIKFAAGVEPLRIANLARVEFGSSYRTGAATRNGQETVLGTVMMLIGQNADKVCPQVVAKMNELRGQLPEGMQLQIVYNRAEVINRTVDTVRHNLFEGALLVAAIVFLLLGNWRAALIVTLSIPLAFLCALIGMDRLGISGNLMSLGAIDFGMIIDGSVVIVENVLRRIGERQQELGRTLNVVERQNLVKDAATEVAKPMFFGVMIITIVYIPILTLTGVEGKMFQPMAITVILALLSALFLALTLMPVLCTFLLRGRIREKESLIVRMCKGIYQPVLRLAFAHRFLVIAAAITILAGALLLLSRMGSEFIPTLDEGSYDVMVYRKSGMSLEKSLAMEEQSEKVLRRDFPEITDVYARIGTSEIASDPMPASENDLYVSYKPESQWSHGPARPKDKADLTRMIQEDLHRQVPGQEFDFSQPIQTRFNEMLEGVRSQLSVKIFGQDFNVLEDLAAKIQKVLQSTPGAREVNLETNGRTPSLQMDLRRDQLVRYNLRPQDVNDAVTTSLAGRMVGQLIDNNRRYDIDVRMPDTARADQTEMEKIPIRVGPNGLLPLGDLVNFRVIEEIVPILRDNGERRSAIMVNLGGRDVEGYINEVKQRIAAEVKIPPDYRIEFGGEFKNLEAARARLTVIVPVAMALIFVLIFFVLNSVRQSFLVFTGIPFAVSGGVFALYLRGLPFSIPAAIGFIALSGVAVLNGLVLVSYFNQLRLDGASLDDTVFKGGLTRLRPVLTTALVAALGFVPMAFSTSAGAEVQRPLATVVIGGIISSTLLTLIVLPVLYRTFIKQDPAPSGLPKQPLRPLNYKLRNG
jgi:cobalt-zinc-cadmium resistance protein CzcA